MTAQVLDKVVNRLKNFPDDKVNSLLDYADFLEKKTRRIRKHIPNKTTLQTLEDTQNRKNIIECDNIEDMFNKLGI
ncbi:MAG: hypothetical protein A2Z98_15765 [Spirochaetes bacterium GWB1_27_13]|nr:MAG: hypothetical protein A2Z98_15765 [Spirochaetes bacterium GWB1_27_13]